MTRLAYILLPTFMCGCEGRRDDGWRLTRTDQSPVKAIAKANAVALVDFNRDRLLDIAAVNGDAGQLLVLINQGGGRFAPFQGEGRFVQFPEGIIPLGEGAGGLAIGDLNGDRAPDIVISHHDSWEVSVVLCNGHATFEPLRRVAVAHRGEDDTPHVHNLALADLNSDGALDLVLAQAEEHTIIAALGDGKGGFTPVEGAFAAGEHPYTVVAADFNRDGRIDVASPNAESNDLTIGLGDGAGKFVAPPGEARVTLPPQTLALAAGDINGDGFIDLVGNSDQRQSELSLLLGDGKGGFTSSDHAFNAPARCYNHVIADLNGDGMMDVSAPSIDRSSVIVWVAEDPKYLRFNRVEFETPGVDSQVLAVGDIDGDGMMDAVTAGWDTPALCVLIALKGE